MIAVSGDVSVNDGRMTSPSSTVTWVWVEQVLLPLRLLLRLLLLPVAERQSS
jgi:hypothetical protein